MTTETAIQHRGAQLDTRRKTGTWHRWCLRQLESWKEAIRITPTNTEAYHNLGVALCHLGRYKEALEAFRVAIGLKPDDSYAYYNLGVAYACLGQHEEAIAAFQDAIFCQSDFVEAYLNLAAIHGDLGQYREAIKRCQEAIRIRPDFVEAHYNLGWAYAMVHDEAAAVRVYNILEGMDMELASKLFNIITQEGRRVA